MSIKIHISGNQGIGKSQIAGLIAHALRHLGHEVSVRDDVRKPFPGDKVSEQNSDGFKEDYYRHQNQPRTPINITVGEPS